MGAPARTVLILGGTGEARELARLLAQDGRQRVVTSLAGRTPDPAAIAGATRTGGFGGVAGLVRYIAEKGIDLIADATHPFAAAMSRHAAEACAQAGIAYLRLERPAWQAEEGDDWRAVASIEEAAQALEAGARALVTVGRQEIAPFLARNDTTILARMIAPPDATMPAHVRLILARPPFALEDELRLLEREKVSVVVSKNSGGEATRAKLLAARARRLPVVMVARPAKPDAATAATAEELARMVRNLV